MNFEKYSMLDKNGFCFSQKENEKDHFDSPNIISERWSRILAQKSVLSEGDE